MTVDDAVTVDAALDGLLILWHAWASTEHVGQGYPSEAPGCKLYRVSRQYDYDNGAMDGEVDATMGAAVDALVNQMKEPYRTAIHINARNLKTGVSVWSSGRLPIDPQERATILMDARTQITKKLQSAGLL
jgi:hypothetical protein